MDDLPALQDEVVYANGDQFFAELYKSLNQAQKSVSFESYIFNQDRLGQEVIEHLHQAVLRGVRVQLLLDGVGCSQWTLADLEKVKRLGIEVHFFHPLPWQRRTRRIWSKHLFRKWAQELFRLNHRNHRKLIIIDDHILFIGSYNVMEQVVPRFAGAQAWRETGVRVTNRDLSFYQNVSKEAWMFSRNYYHRKQSRPHFVGFFGNNRLIGSRKERNFKYQMLISQLKSADTRIWLTSAYFVPDRRIMRHLRHASRRGVSVKLLFPSKSDFFAVKYAMESFYKSLLKAKIEVYEYLPSMLHAKVLCFDDLVSLGSTNLDHRSLFQDLEANISIKHPANVALIHSQFAADLEKSRKLELSEWKKRPLFDKIMEALFLFFKRML